MQCKIQTTLTFYSPYLSSPSFSSSSREILILAGFYNPTPPSWPPLTLTNSSTSPSTPTAPSPATTSANDTDLSASVWSKDIPLNSDNETWLRLYLPRNLPAGKQDKLPVIVYFHGGGFVFLRADNDAIHAFCEYMAAELTVLVVSVNYRLTPEHRLPAAYDDAVETLDLIRTSSDHWISGYAELSRCILMGESAGGNIAYHAGLRASDLTEALKPIQIRGLVLVQPYFGGSERTESETRLKDNPFFPLSVCDLMWELSLPFGSDLDHEFCNPTVGDGGSAGIERMKELGWRVVVTAVDGDLLFDREV